MREKLPEALHPRPLRPVALQAEAGRERARPLLHERLGVHLVRDPERLGGRVHALLQQHQQIVLVEALAKGLPAQRRAPVRVMRARAVEQVAIAEVVVGLVRLHALVRAHLRPRVSLTLVLVAVAASLSPQGPPERAGEAVARQPHREEPHRRRVPLRVHHVCGVEVRPHLHSLPPPLPPLLRSLIGPHREQMPARAPDVEVLRQFIAHEVRGQQHPQLRPRLLRPPAQLRGQRIHRLRQLIADLPDEAVGPAALAHVIAHPAHVLLEERPERLRAHRHRLAEVALQRPRPGQRHRRRHAERVVAKLIEQQLRLPVELREVERHHARVVH